jgi:hypothetical protein
MLFYWLTMSVSPYATVSVNKMAFGQGGSDTVVDGNYRLSLNTTLVGGVPTLTTVALIGNIRKASAGTSENVNLSSLIPTLTNGSKHLLGIEYECTSVTGGVRSFAISIWLDGVKVISNTGLTSTIDLDDTLTGAAIVGARPVVQSGESFIGRLFRCGTYDFSVAGAATPADMMAREYALEAPILAPL